MQTARAKMCAYVRKREFRMRFTVQTGRSVTTALFCAISCAWLQQIESRFTPHRHSPLSLIRATSAHDLRICIGHCTSTTPHR
jgi:hypothetical protein